MMKNRRRHAQEYQDGKVAVVVFLEVGSPLLGGSPSDRVAASKGWAKPAKATPQRIKNSPDDRADTL